MQNYTVKSFDKNAFSNQIYELLMPKVPSLADDLICFIDAENSYDLKFTVPSLPSNYISI